MRTAFVSLWIALAPLTSGCMAGMAGHAGHTAPPAQPAQPPEAHAHGTVAMPMHACPIAVPGTQLAAADTPDGVSVTFTTSPDRAEDLRARVHAMADMHNRHHLAGGPEGTHAGHGGMEHGGMMGGGMMGGGMMGGGSTAGAGAGQASMMPPPSRATVVDVEGGARLVVTPNDPADMDQLRSTVRTHAEHMQKTGTCRMGPPAG